MSKLEIKVGDSLRFTDEQKERIAFFRQRTIQLLKIVLGILATAALTLIILDFGFYLTDEQHQAIFIANRVIVTGFAIQFLLRLLLEKDKRVFLRSHPIETVVVLILIGFLTSPQQIQMLMLSLFPILGPEQLATLYLGATQLLAVLAFVPSVIRNSNKLMLGGIQPAAITMISFSTFILVGALFLMLPKSTYAGNLAFVDALFTSTSAVCVTGLTVHDTGTTFTLLGKTVILILMQVGGIGIMTLTTFFAMFLGSSGNLRERSTLQSVLGAESVGRIKTTIITITLTTLVLEGIGAVILYHSLTTFPFQSDFERWFYAIFHSVSAFCNAGFSTTSLGAAHPLLNTNLGFVWTISILIILGGIGFPVMMNLYRILSPRQAMRATMSISTKLVLITTLILLATGMLFFYALERNNLYAGMSIGESMLHSWFFSVTARTAGFNTLDVASLSLPSLFVLMVLMWIGASPASTGGGIKTTTLAVALLNIKALVTGRDRLEIFKREVAEISVVKAISTALLSFFFIGAGTFLLLLTEPFPFHQIIFEVISALGTVGLTTGITPELSTPARIVITSLMFAGRIGLLSIVLAITPTVRSARYSYIKEQVIIT